MASKINHFLLHLLRFKPFLGVNALNGAREKHFSFMTDGTVLLAMFIVCPAQVR